MLYIPIFFATLENFIIKANSLAKNLLWVIAVVMLIPPIIFVMLYMVRILNDYLDRRYPERVISRQMKRLVIWRKQLSMAMENRGNRLPQHKRTRTIRLLKKAIAEVEKDLVSLCQFSNFR